MVEIYSKDGKFFKNKACTSEFSDQETAAILWKLNQTIENADKYRLPRIGAKLRSSEGGDVVYSV